MSQDFAETAKLDAFERFRGQESVIVGEAIATPHQSWGRPSPVKSVPFARLRACLLSKCSRARVEVEVEDGPLIGLAPTLRGPGSLSSLILVSRTTFMSSKHLTIAVAGADGRVGSGVVREALAQGHTVVGLDATREDLVKPRERYSYKRVDTTNFEAYKEAIKGCDALIHLAATMNKVKDAEGNRTRPTADHEIHNNSVAMSFNALSVAEALGINRVVLASSVNSIGMLYSEDPKFDYLPLDEKHRHRPEDAYSLCKYIVEIQSDAFVRRLPTMRIATMRFHYIVPEEQVNPTFLNQNHSSWKDLWGFTPVTSAARACINALTVSEEQFPPGHETFWIVADTTQKQSDSYELLQSSPLSHMKDLRVDFKGSNRGFYDTSKAERLLGWKEVGFPWKG